MNENRLIYMTPEGPTAFPLSLSENFEMYSIQAGDSFWKLTNSYYAIIDDHERKICEKIIKEHNPTINPNSLQIGEKMAYDYDRNVRSRATTTEIDLGLKAYMNKVYSFMAVGLALTGVIAHLTSKMAFDFSTNTMTSFGAAIYASPLAFIIMLSPLAFILALNFGIAKMKESTVQILFWAFAVLWAYHYLQYLSNIQVNL